MRKFSLRLVRSSERLFWSGRTLVRRAYAAAWATAPESMGDDYDFAVLICDHDEVLGNLNIKRRTADTLLPSETYFRQRHWEGQCEVDAGKVAELCSLAVCASLSNRERILVFNGLILGTHLLGMQEDIRVYATVQRTALINTLTRLLKYPFIASQIQDVSGAGIPDDKYWTTAPMPQLYYLVHGASTDTASFKLLHSFLRDGLSIEPVCGAPGPAASAPPPLALE